MFVEISPALCPCSLQADTFLFLCCRFSGLWGRGGGAECGWASPSLKQNSKVIFVQQTGKSQWLGHRRHWHTRWLLAKYENWMNSHRIHEWRAMKYDVCWTTDLSGHQTPKIKSLSNEQVNKEEKKKRKIKEGRKVTHMLCVAISTYPACRWTHDHNHLCTSLHPLNVMHCVWVWMSVWERVSVLLPRPHLWRWNKVHRIWNMCMNLSAWTKVTHLRGINK